MAAMSETEYSVFSSPNFDANEYANSVLIGEPYPVKTGTAGVRTATMGSQIVKEDVSVAISRLDSAIESISKQLKNVVTTHHEELLVQAAGVSDLQGSLRGVRIGLDELDASVEKLRVKIRVPYQSLNMNVAKLEKLHHASDVLRRISRFVVLARRLETQMVELDKLTTEDAKESVLAASLDGENEKERTIAKAALGIAELGALLDATEPRIDETGTSSPVTAPVPLRSLSVVAAHIPFIESARATVTAEMESTILAGLTHLNQALLASSLQTAHNLRVLPSLVANLVTDLASAVESRIRSAFDMAAISKEMVGKEPPAPSGYLYKSRIRTEPTNVTQPQWANVLWSRLEFMIDEMADCCIKVYTLEKVLKLRKDHVTQVEFLDEAMQDLEEKPTLIFWHALARALEAQIQDAMQGSTFLQQTLSSGYTKLLRLFHDFFGKIALYSDTIYTQATQSPETILVLRALAHVETAYLSKSSIRLNESIGQAFVGGTRSPPGTTEAITIARAVANEMDGAKFDPILVKAIARSVKSSIEMLLGRVESLVVRDRTAFTLLGPAATSQQISNGQIASFLWHTRDRIARLKADHSESAFAILAPALEGLEREYGRITDPLLSSLRRELGGIIARLHKLDFGSAMDGGMGMGMAGGSSSMYMRELIDKLTFVKTEIFANFSIGEARWTWSTDIARYVLRTFTLHMSIVRPLGEGGKLQLTTDMTELEFALSAFVVDPAHPRKTGGGMQALGDEYRLLRAMRPLLFLDNPSLARPEQTAGVPPLIVLHHVLVRSPLPLPHALHGWQEAEYVRWVAEHSQRDALALVEGGITRWERTQDVGDNSSKGEEYVQIARAILTRVSDESSA